MPIIWRTLRFLKHVKPTFLSKVAIALWLIIVIIDSTQRLVNQLVDEESGYEAMMLLVEEPYKD